MDSHTKLTLALAGTRPRAGRGLARRVDRDGPQSLIELFDDLDKETKVSISRQAEQLENRGIRAVLRGMDDYPRRLSLLTDAPPVLFYSGHIDLARQSAIGICGSRNVSDEGLRAASSCGELAATHGIISVSGYARGVDTATHIASLRAGGATIIVLPEGIDHFRIKRDIDAVWSDNRALIISQFAPTQTWSAGGAMARNSVIIGLSLALVVVEAGEKGGTLAAGSKALELERRVLALEFATTPIGNRLLLDRGAVPVRDRSELAVFLDELRHVADEPERIASLNDQDYLY